uniref:Uncharacterized protein n=1 Tax=Rhizophora mucronata TaxID=61149 RepID=A0A2P2MUN4_RHIMU
MMRTSNRILTLKLFCSNLQIHTL